MSDPKVYSGKYRGIKYTVNETPEVSFDNRTVEKGWYGYSIHAHESIYYGRGRRYLSVESAKSQAKRTINDHVKRHRKARTVRWGKFLNSPIGVSITSVLAVLISILMLICKN